MAKKKELINVSEKLDQLALLQSIHSKLDEIKILKGELPIEVSDLEDEIVGLEKRITKISDDLVEAEKEIALRKDIIKDAQAMILKYDKQLNNVKNNREFDALNKELELQKLEIQLCEKRIKDATFTVDNTSRLKEDSIKKIDIKKGDLEGKKKELDQIVKDTEKEEKELNAKILEVSAEVEERLLTAFNRIRNGYKNGLAVVKVSRNSCGGCFGFIPPQIQSDIRTKKKLSTCEHCGRIFSGVDDDVVLHDEEIA